MVIVATAIILGLPANRIESLKSKDSVGNRVGMKCIKRRIITRPIPGENSQNPFPEEFWKRLYRIAQFSHSITKPDGCIVQIGDNDSGRFFKLMTLFKKMSVNEANSRFINLAEYDYTDNEEDYLWQNGLDQSHVLALFKGLIHLEFENASENKCRLKFHTEITSNISGLQVPLRFDNSPKSTKSTI